MISPDALARLRERSQGSPYVLGMTASDTMQHAADLRALLAERKALVEALTYFSIIRPNREDDDKVQAFYNVLTDPDRALWDRAEYYTWSRAWNEVADKAASVLGGGETK